MVKIAAETLKAYRSALDLCSTEPAQLRRTIAELEARIHEQDTLIAEKTKHIEDLEILLGKRDNRLKELETARCNPANELHNIPDGLALQAQMEQLKKANSEMENAMDELQDGFWHLWEAQLENIRDSLKTIEQMPATPELKGLYARSKREVQAVISAKKRNQLSPVNALRQLADLDKGIINFIVSRPALTFSKAEVYRGRILIEALYRDPKLKSITTPESMRILSEIEEKPINAKQSLRAMRKAAIIAPDKVKFELKGKGRKARLRKIESKEAEE